MSPNEISSEFNKVIIFSSSESSDSESFLQEDLENPGNYINKQWEAIERTLYQEPGQQVTDPELLKECKLWRDKFPHFRLKGTKINLKQSGNEVDESDKNIQTLEKHFDLKKLEEKRENIKKKVVEGLVERLITKYGLEKEESANSELNKNLKNDVQKTEAVDDFSEKSSNSSTKNNVNKSVLRNLKASSDISTDKESYFERGKETDVESVHEMNYFYIAEAKKNFYEMFDLCKKNNKTSPKLPDSCDYNKVISPKKDSLPEKSLEKPIAGRFRTKKCMPPYNSLSDITKPFKPTKKINKNYEGLIEKIMEPKCNEFNIIRHCRTSASGLDIKSYQESLEKMKKGSGFDEYLKRKELAKINKFNNNWLKRSEMNSYHEEDDFVLKNTQSAKIFLDAKRDNNLDEIDERFLEELRKEMTYNIKRPVKKIRPFEEINLQRPKPFIPAEVKTLKSSSCRDFTKKNKKEVKGKPQRNGLEIGKSESNLKSNLKFKNLNNNKRCKSNAVQNSLLPPIETGIICTELTGRPKIAPKKTIKRN